MGAFGVLGFALALAFAGVGAQVAFHANTLPGAGAASILEARGAAAAGGFQRYANQCIAAAVTAAGSIAASITVDLATSGGADVSAPSGAGCMTSAVTGGGRNVFAYAKFQPGLVAKLSSETYQSSAWYVVTAKGSAQRILDGGVVTVPTTIPVDSVLKWVQISL